MKPSPGQLSLFELDARGEPQVEKIEAALLRAGSRGRFGEP